MRDERLIFEVKQGWVGVAATPRGLIRSVLPRQSRETVETLLTFPDEIPGGLVVPHEEAMRLLTAYYRGEHVDLGRIALDMTGIAPFDREVYEVLLGVGWGDCLTYGQIALRSGHPGAARAVGGAMARNPLPPFIPCHRVVGAGGRMVGFTSEGGISLKRRLLEMEGVSFRGERAAIV